MTKEKLFKNYSVTFGVVIINKTMYCINRDYLKKEFEAFYKDLTSVIKVSNIDELYFITETKEEDNFGITVSCNLSIGSKAFHFNSIYHFFAVKVKKNISSYTKDNDMKFYD